MIITAKRHEDSNSCVCVCVGGGGGGGRRGEGIQDLWFCECCHHNGVVGVRSEGLPDPLPSELQRRRQLSLQVISNDKGKRFHHLCNQLSGEGLLHEL